MGSPTRSSAKTFRIALIALMTIEVTQTHPIGAGYDSVQINPAQDQYAAKTSSFNINRQTDSVMQVHKLSSSGNNITCNDGSQIGYYKRLNNHSKSWIIYLQGGGFCNSPASCQQRWQRTPHLMSSKFWPPTKLVDGILSSDSKENPYLWNANHIYVPYCSSDSWTGSSPGRAEASIHTETRSFAFMGSQILEQVFDSLYEDLPRDSSLYRAKFILLVGDSAGATGVIMNLDRMNKFVERKAVGLGQACGQECEKKQVPVFRGLADSGWFLDNEPYELGVSDPETRRPYETDCDQNKCSPLETVKQAMGMWNGQVPPACALRHPSEPWRCYFGYRAYRTLQTPLFVVQWLYDEAQLMADNIARPDTNGQWNYVNKVVNEMKASLENVTALFAPSCFSHSLVLRPTWSQININGLKLPQVLNSWEEQSLLEMNTGSNFGRIDKADDSVRSAVMHESAENSSDGQPIHTSLARVNFSYMSILNQPTFETVPIDREPLNQSRDTGQKTFGINHEYRQGVLRSVPTNGRGRNRKRKRNNQQRLKQTRQKLIPTTENYHSISEGSPPQAITRDPGNASIQTNPLHDLVPLIDRSLASAEFATIQLNDEMLHLGSNTGRSGRSTLIDDATLMLSNNVPEDSNTNQMSIFARDNQGDIRRPGSFDHHTKPLSTRLIPPTKHESVSRFRLIDLCGWPQCNRDCPVMESDLTSSFSLT